MRINDNSYHIPVKGHIGKWYVIDSMIFDNKKVFLLEHENFGDEAACLITDENVSVVLEDVWNGFGDLYEQLDQAN